MLYNYQTSYLGTDQSLLRELNSKPKQPQPNCYISYYLRSMFFKNYSFEENREYPQPYLTGPINPN